ncbi:diaminopimelate epimerase [Rugamonas sp. CCM 8940]|uniref:diaminopimelate epimerase n=1 Tax=Rugamonas sp. CCM 8940 TaxID=2765359 RepID=UPI0018F34C41|nr:diaminopimelate epimerase [Rugamonas sp. CCM 8940]MBJ7310107.1 diaminopimelate epimerase [Rugamonas sp. CCM 8940]
MKLKFTKMHGAGNDFIVVDAINQQVELSAAQWRRLADRRFGIGADQILVVERPTLPGCDFRYRIFNNDGGEVEQCGNGARAFVKFVAEKGLTGLSSIRVETKAGVIAPRLEADGSITVDMGAPQLAPAQVPFDADGLAGVAAGRDTLWPLVLELGGARETVLVSVLSMGNPHAVQVVDDVDSAPVDLSGPLIEHHPRFPRRVNAGFMQVLGRRHIKLRVYERGAGETLACGTGACAAVVAGIRRGLLDSPVRVDARGGQLSIAWAGEGEPVCLSGPAVTVFEGEITL